jgi:AcrR family transcriptional regulator
MDKPSTERASLGNKDWVDAASEALAESGIDAVRVEPLARALKVTKGSFYWHFSNRQELLAAVLNRWRKRATQDVIQRINSSESSAKDRLVELFEIPKHGKHARAAANLETAIRQWSKRDQLARAAVDEVDQHRLTYIKGLYSELGYLEQDAQDKAVLFYCTMQGMSNVSDLVNDRVLASGKQQLLLQLDLAEPSEPSVD